MIESGIQPIIGCNLSFSYKNIDGSLVLLAKNEEGYKNLIRLSSELYLSNNNEKLSLNYLSKFNEGLILLSGGYGGLVNNFLKHGRKKDAVETIKNLNSLFKSRFYLEFKEWEKMILKMIFFILQMITSYPSLHQTLFLSLKINLFLMMRFSNKKLHCYK